MHRCALFECLFLDTGALYHVIPHWEWYCTYSPITDCAEIDASYSDVAGIGNVHLVFADGASLLLRDVKHVPQP